VSGVKVPKLGSLEDRILRQFLIKESEKEAKKTYMLAMIAANSIQFTDQQAATEWEQKVKKIYNQYLGLEYGIEIPEHDERELQLLEYYQNTVKKLRPKLVNEGGKLTVFGLDKINPQKQK
jgi:hypothetical protein